MALPKVKKRKPRAAPRIKRGAKLAAPSWDGWETWTGEQVHRHREYCRSFYYEHYKPADLYPAIYKWMEQNGYTKTQIKHAKAAPNHSVSITSAIVAQCFIDGAPDYVKIEDEYWQSLAGTMGEKKGPSEFLIKKVELYIESGSKAVEVKTKEEKEKANVYVPSIQERIREQTFAMCEDIDEWLEDWTENVDKFDPKGFDFKQHFQKVGTTQAHARKMKQMYENTLDDFNDLERFPTAGQLKKMDELEADLWQQLKEGYSHVKKGDIKKLRTAMDGFNTALDFIIDQAKANRKPRKSKPKSAEKLVEKLKYAKVNDKFQLASINPVDIVGASELWVFNCKTRKLGKYVAGNIDPTGMQRGNSGLQVKGTTILGFDEKLSVQKTLRKPDVQLKEFKGAGKVALRKFLDDIATTDTKLNGRCNLDTILLKVS